MSAAKKKHKWVKWVAIVVAVVVIIALAMTALAKRGTESLDTYTAKTQDLRTWYSFSGTLEPVNQQSVTAASGTKVKTVHVKEGDQVKEGDVLFDVETINAMGQTETEELTAKQDGEVGEVNVKEGDTVLGDKPLTTVADYRTLEVDIKVDEYDVSALKVGKEVDVKVNAQDKSVKGKVQRVSHEATSENNVSYFPAKIRLEDSSGLYAGMSAEVTMLNQQAKGAVTLPEKALQFDEENQPYVLVKNADGKLQRKEVKTGLTDGTTVQITEGVSNGEQVYAAKESTNAFQMMAEGGDRERTASNAQTQEASQS